MSLDSTLDKHCVDFSHQQRTLTVKVETESRDVEIRFTLPIHLIEFGKSEGFDRSVAEIAYGEGLTGYGFSSDKMNKKRASMTFELKLANNPSADLEIIIMTSDEKSTYITISNQERFISSFTTSGWQYDTGWKKYVSKDIVPNARFTLS